MTSPLLPVLSALFPFIFKLLEKVLPSLCLYPSSSTHPLAHCSLALDSVILELLSPGIGSLCPNSIKVCSLHNLLTGFEWLTAASSQKRLCSWLPLPFLSAAFLSFAAILLRFSFSVCPLNKVSVPSPQPRLFSFTISSNPVASDHLFVKVTPKFITAAKVSLELQTHISKCFLGDP